MLLWDAYSYIFLLIPVIGLLGGYFLLEQWKKKKQREFSDHHLFTRLVQTDRGFKNNLKYGLRLLILVILMVAIMGLQKKDESIEIKQKGIDWVFVLDVSKSMDAQDVLPSRLIKAKKIIEKLTMAFPGNQVGLVIYAGTAHQMLPLTEDYQALNIMLKGVNSQMLSHRGTSIGQALQKAIELFKIPTISDKAIVLLSDGEDHEGHIKQAMAVLQKSDIHTISIGLGTDKGGVIPINKDEGYLKYQGEVVITRCDEEMLKKIAQEAKGMYVSGNQNVKNIINDIRREVQNYRETLRASTSQKGYKLYYQLFSVIALILLIIEEIWVLSYIKGKRK